MATPVAPSGPPPPTPYYWYPPPPKPDDSKLAILIVVVVLIVIIVPIVLAAVLYVMVGGLIEGPGPGQTRPQVALGPANTIPDGFEFVVNGVSQALPASSYRLSLVVNGSASDNGSEVLRPSMTFTVGGATYTVTWMDIGGEDDLTGGDIFRVLRAGGISSQTNVLVVLLWIDGSTVGSRTYP